METWTPIELDKLNSLIIEGNSKMSDIQKHIWELISIEPEKWQEVEFGKDGGGFWAVALAGHKVIWYNDIEEGFNVSSYSKYGQLGAYGAEQDELQWAMNKIK